MGIYDNYLNSYADYLDFRFILDFNLTKNLILSPNIHYMFRGRNLKVKDNCNDKFYGGISLNYSI